MLIIPSETWRKQTSALTILESAAARLEARSPLLAGPILGMHVGAESDRIRAAKDYVHSLRLTKSDQSVCSLPEQLNCPQAHLVHGVSY